jgi:hypothetical protein
VTIDGIWIVYCIYWYTCTHHSELQVITALPLISTLYKSPQRPLSLFPACWVNSRSLAMTSSSEYSSASGAHVVTVRRISRNWTLFFTAGLSTVNWTVGPSLLSLPCRAQLNSRAGLGSSLYIASGQTHQKRYGSVYRAIAQKRPFVYSPIAQQRVYTTQY